MFVKVGLVLVFGIVMISQYSKAQLCGEWGSVKLRGNLDPALIHESSGLEVSSQFEDRLYHINDSGSGPQFFVTDKLGKGTEVIDIVGVDFRDTEDLSYGDCGPNRGNCLYIGDIGDNKRKRSYVEFIIIEEMNKFFQSVSPLKVVRASYPDRAHNAEAFAIHPNGDLFLITKVKNKKEDKISSVELYRLSASEIWSKKEQVELQLLGKWDLSLILPGLSEREGRVTGMDISSTGEKVLVLLYGAILELNFDLSEEFIGVESWREGDDFQLVAHKRLQQQEAIAFDFFETGFLYSTELREPAPLQHITCRK